MIVVDTHTWIWWASGEPALSERAIDAIDDTDFIGVPAICRWEVSMLVQRGRVRLDRELLPWLHDATTTRKARLLPLTPEIGATAGTFDNSWISDPADRLIVATAIEHRVPLITKDRRIHRSGLVETIW